MCIFTRILTFDSSAACNIVIQAILSAVRSVFPSFRKDANPGGDNKKLSNKEMDE